MATQRVQRKLAAILVFDVVGYSRLMRLDEEGTLARLKSLRGYAINPAIAAHDGRVFKLVGDGALVEFSSAVDAVRCAVEIQALVEQRNAQLPEERRVELRIAVNVGDVIVDEADIYGDGVNLASRLEQLADPGGICISGAAYDQVAGKIPHTLEFVGEQPLKGFDQPVRIYRVAVGSGATPPRQPAMPIRDASMPEPIGQSILAGVNGPRIAVLPFRNMSPNPDEEFFVDGLVEEMTLALSASRSFPVIASSATTAFKGRGVAPNVAGKELGAQYVLNGGVRRAGDRLRISVELVNVDTQLQEWSERYEHSIDDLFAIQDDITRAVVANVEPEIDELEVRRMLSSRPASFSSYELAQKGFWHLSKRTFEDYGTARPLFQMSLQSDQRYARAHAGMAQGKYMAGMRLWEDRRGAFEKAIECGTAALDIDERDPRALRYLGGAKAALGQFAEGIEALRRAITLHPSYAAAYSALGFYLAMAGNFEAAIEAEATTTRLRPGDRALYICMMARGVAKYELGEYDTAAEVCRESLDLNDTFWLSNLMHVATLGQLGRDAELPAAVSRLQAILPDLTAVKLAALLRFAQRAHLEHVIEGLRKAGVNTA